MKLKYALPALMILAVSAAGMYFMGVKKPTATETASTTQSADQGLSIFMSLHALYCEKRFNSREDLITALVNDDRFRPSKDYPGVFEIMIKGVEYAISPEEDGCTTDVLVKRGNAKAIFSYEQMTQNLQRRGYKANSAETPMTDLGMDEKNVTVMERIFTSPQGEQARLAFPIDRPDQYYTTLYTKKFPEPEKGIGGNGERALTIKE